MTRRGRRRVEAAAVLLAFPLAVLLTVAAISLPSPASHDGRTPQSSSAEPAATTAGGGARIAIEGGTPVTSYGLADRLTSAGFRLVSISPVRKSNRMSTEIVYYRRVDRERAELLRRMLGVGTIHREQLFSPPSDLKILMGKDLQRT